MVVKDIVSSNEGGKIAKTKPMAKVKVTIGSINMVDVNVTTWSKASEEQMFKDWKQIYN